MFEGLKARLERLLADATPRGDGRGIAAGLHEAAVEAKVAVRTMQEALVVTERELAMERDQHAAAVRRGQLAAAIPDAETVAVAERFALRHAGRITLLEKKLQVQQEELVLAERELAEMTAELRGGGGAAAAASSVEQAWRELASAGGVRPETDLEGELLDAQANRKLHEQAVEAQLAHLKKKMGKP